MLNKINENKGIECESGNWIEEKKETMNKGGKREREEIFGFLHSAFGGI